MATGRGILADFWVPHEIESCNFQNLLVFRFPETSQNLIWFRQLLFSIFPQKSAKIAPSCSQDDLALLIWGIIRIFFKLQVRFLAKIQPILQGKKNVFYEYMVLFQKWTFNPNWHEAGHFPPSVFFGSDFISWIFTKKF